MRSQRAECPYATSRQEWDAPTRTGTGVASGDLFLFASFDRDADYRTSFDGINAGVDALFENVGTEAIGIPPHVTNESATNAPKFAADGSCADVPFA